MWPPKTRRGEASPDCLSTANDCLHWSVRRMQVVARVVQVVEVVVAEFDTLPELLALKDETQQGDSY